MVIVEYWRLWSWGKEKGGNHKEREGGLVKDRCRGRVRDRG